MKRECKTPADRLQYAKDYYQLNKEKIHDRYVEAKLSKMLRRSDMVMYREWLYKLQERLKAEDLHGWLLWALELTRDKIIEEMEKLDGKEYRQTHKNNRTPDI